MEDQAITPSWADLAAGAATPASLSVLATVDPSTLTGAQLVDAVLCSEKAASLILGRQAELMAALAVPFAAGDPMRLAGRLARRSGLTGGDDDDTNVQAMVEEAAACLAAGEIAAALRIAPVTAGIRVREAQLLTGDFTPARQALENGDLDRGKLRAIVEQVQVLPTDKVGPVLDQVLPAAADRCTSEIREIAAQAVITADPDGAADRHHQAAARREVKLTPGADAMATLKAYLPADGAVKIFQVSDLLATGTAGIPDDARGIGARRADALIDLADRLLTDGHIDLTGYLGQPLPDHGQPRPRTGPARPTDTPTEPAVPADLTGSTAQAGPGADQHPDGDDAIGWDTGDRTGSDADPAVTASATDTDTDTDTDEVAPGPAAQPSLPVLESPASAPTGRPDNRTMSRQGRRPHLTVTLSLDTLAGLNDLPALLAGFGSIPADLARSIAAGAGTITTALTDPATGAITTAGELTYRPRQTLRDQVGTITDTCQFPSCRQPAWRCDIDHRDPFNHHNPSQGGRTTLSNNESLCRRHHLLKDHADWRVNIDPTRLVINWTSPTGHTYHRKSRQTTPPDAWIHTAGTTIAEQLDTIAAMRANTTPTGSATLTRYLADIEPDIHTTSADDRAESAADTDDHPTTDDHPATGALPTAGALPTTSALPTADALPTTSATHTGPAETTPDQHPPGQSSPFEDRLTDALLRHALNNGPRIEYEPETHHRPEVAHGYPDGDSPEGTSGLDDDLPPF